MIAPSISAVVAPDRRSGERQVAVLMIGRVDRAERQQVCIIRNISANGVMARFAEVPAVGERMIIECRALPATLAIVRWAHGDVAGLELLHLAVPPLEDVPGGRRRVARAPRFGIMTAAKIQIGPASHVAKLRNISVGGACVEGCTDVDPGVPVMLVLPHLLAATPARVVWRAEHRVGISFNAPLLLGALTQIVHAPPAP